MHLAIMSLQVVPASAVLCCARGVKVLPSSTLSCIRQQGIHVRTTSFEQSSTVPITFCQQLNASVSAMRRRRPSHGAQGRASLSWPWQRLADSHVIAHGGASKTKRAAALRHADWRLLSAFRQSSGGLPGPSLATCSGTASGRQAGGV